MHPSEHAAKNPEFLRSPHAAEFLPRAAERIIGRKKFDASAVAALREAGLRFEAMATASAAQTYNILLSEGRKVAAALIAVQ